MDPIDYKPGMELHCVLRCGRSVDHFTAKVRSVRAGVAYLDLHAYGNDGYRISDGRRIDTKETRGWGEAYRSTEEYEAMAARYSAWRTTEEALKERLRRTAPADVTPAILEAAQALLKALGD